MGERVEKRYTWVLKKFSTLQDPSYHSRPFPFAGWNWQITAHLKENGNDGHLSLFLDLIDPQSLPSGWRREIKFSFTVENKKYCNYTKELDGQAWFDASHHGWGFKKVLPLSKIRYRDDGFLIGDKLVIVAKLHVFPLVLVPKETVKIIEPLRSKEDLAVDKTQGESLGGKTENAASQENVDYDDVSKKNPCVDTSEKTLNDEDPAEEVSYDNDDDVGASKKGSGDDDASEVGLDDNDDDGGASEEGSGDDDDASEEGLDDGNNSSIVSDDGGREESLLNQTNTLEEGSLEVGNNVASETEVTNDDAPKDDDDTSSLVSSVSDKDAGSLNKVKSMEDTSRKVENGDTGCNNVTFVTEASSEIQPVKETMDVNGFQVLSSEVEYLRHIFKRHPDIALGFRAKNQQIRRAYMNELGSLIEMLCQSPEKLSEDDLSNADDTLVDLIDAGFKLDWLKIKLSEVSEKKKIVQGSGTRLTKMEEELQKLKQMFLDLESQLLKEKAEYTSARAPLSFSDVVC